MKKYISAATGQYIFGKYYFGLLLLLPLFYFTCIYHIEPNEMGIGWNPFSGQLRGDTTAGYYVSPPWDFVSVIDLRPVRVCITSSANSYSCKLASFDKKHWREFVEVQGFHYYWWSNRFSFNSGYETYRGFRDIMRGYAYGNNKYEFIKIINDNYSNTNP